MSTQGITYELALALKNAGFPQIEPLSHFDAVCGDKPGLKIGSECYLKSPTLEELIEACGDEFVCVREYRAEMIRAGQAKYAPKEKQYIAESTRVQSSDEGTRSWVTAEGNTAILAVANLFISLHRE